MRTGMRTVWEIWRYLGAAVSAALLAASQIQPNPLPAWVFPVVAASRSSALASPTSWTDASAAAN